MYILIDEFGEIKQKEIVPVEIYTACDDGLYTVINAETLEEYFYGVWISLDKL